MTKQEFLNELSGKLQGLPKADKETSLEYYSEMLDDRIEDGLTEEQAVKAMGSVNDIAEKIIRETPIEKLLAPKRQFSGVEIALLIIGFPIWLPILTAGFVVAVTLYLVLWVLILCLYVVVLSFILSGIASVAALVANLAVGQAAAGWFIFGCGMVLLGLSIPLCIGAGKATFGCIRMTGSGFQKIKSALVRRKGHTK